MTKMTKNTLITAKPLSVASGTARIATIFFAVQLLFWLVWFGILAAQAARDRGIRLFLLNHAPDELVVVNGDTGQVERRQAVADGLRQLIFSTDGENAYISNAVDVKNKVTVMDAHSFLITERIEVDGIPQDLAIFTDNQRLIVVNGARTDFMANGFDVYDLTQQADKGRKPVLYRAREMKLVDEVAYDPNTGMIFAIDSKDSKVWVYDFSQKKLVHQIELNTAPIDMHFPEGGDYFFVSTIRREMVFVIDRYTYEIVKRIKVGRCRQIASDKDGKMLYVPVSDSTGKRLVVVDVEEGRALGFVDIPRRCEIIEMSPYYDRVYIVDTSGEGWLICIDVNSIDLKEKTATIVYEEMLNGEFRDIDIRPIGGRS